MEMKRKMKKMKKMNVNKSSDKTYLLMKVREVDIVKEVKEF